MQQRMLHQTYYFNIQTFKNPLDFWVYQEMLCELRPDVVIEIGNYYGGSTLALAHVCDHLQHGQVIGLDIDQHRIPALVRQHPRITLNDGIGRHDQQGQKKPVHLLQHRTKRHADEGEQIPP